MIYFETFCAVMLIINNKLLFTLYIYLFPDMYIYISFLTYSFYKLLITVMKTMIKLTLYS